jgi:DNA mismatch repair ATPase MutL
MKKSLMAAAAAALLAGTSFAAVAQDQRGGSAPEAPMSRGQSGGNESRPQPNAERPSAPRVQQNQGSQHRNDSRAEDRTRPDPNQRGTTGQATQGEDRQPGAQERREQRNVQERQQERQQRNQPTAQERDRRDGQSSGEARGAPSLTTEQKTRIRTSVIHSDRAPRVSSVNFSLNVGTVVPRSVRIVTVPAPLIEIYPAWRGFMYFVVGDEIVIVDPDTLQIVAVLDV